MQLLGATFSHMKKPYQLLIIPLTFWSGVEQGFFGADFTAVRKIRFLIKKFAYFFLLCRGTLHVLGGCKMLDTFWLHTELWMLFVRLVLEASLNMWAECRYFWLVLYSIWFVWLFYLSGHPIRTSPTSFSSSLGFGELQMQCGKRKSMVRFKIYFCIYWNSALKWKSTLKLANQARILLGSRAQLG